MTQFKSANERSYPGICGERVRKYSGGARIFHKKIVVEFVAGGGKPASTDECGASQRTAWKFGKYFVEHVFVAPLSRGEPSLVRQWRHDSGCRNEFPNEGGP